jgi:glycine betaine/proline transport system substrate-binding protein
MDKSFKSIVVLLFSVSLSVQATTTKNETPINVIINNWSSQIVLAHITGDILTSSGFNVNYSEATTNEQWGSLATGIDHIQVEVWQGTMSEMFNRMVKSGGIVDAGNHDATTREDWWYPSYVELVCPGLPNWTALKKCSHLFSSDNSPKGNYVAGPWEKPEAARIRALGLNFSVDTVKAADDLWLALSHAKKNKKPIVLFNWSPNWVEAVYDGKFVEFPEYSPECEEDPAWGINPDFHHDCGNPKNGWLKKAVWAGLPKQWPCAYDILQNINFNNNAIAFLAAEVDFYKKSHQQVATTWILENKQTWEQWIPSHCKTGK